MLPIDRHIHLAKALVIDSNGTSRSVICTQLRGLGVSQIRQVASLKDARAALEGSSFDIVLSELDFTDAPQGGHQLLEEMRRENQLPHATVVLVVTSQTTHNQVVEAAESHVDGILIKPYSTAALENRLGEARRRKKALSPAYEYIAAGKLGEAARWCQQRFARNEPYGLLAAQIGAELWLRGDEAEAALQLYEQVLEEQSPLWAQAGVARCKLSLGELASARRLLDSLLLEQPNYGDGHDLLARVLLEVGELDLALESFRRATALTPGCMLRLQHAGTLAFHLDSVDEAGRLLDRAAHMGQNSRLFDALSLGLLMFVRFEVNDARGLEGSLAMLRGLLERHPSSARLQRLERVGVALGFLLAGKFHDASALANQFAAEVMAPDFDLEAATLTLALWARFPSTELSAKDRDSMLRQVGLRFASSKAITEVLVACGRRMPGGEETLRNCHQQLLNVAEAALNRSMDGHPRQAVDLLLQQGEQTRSSKLIEMAGVLARRHSRLIDDAQQLLEASRKLWQRYCRPMTHIAGIKRSVRVPTGVLVRQG